MKTFPPAAALPLVCVLASSLCAAQNGNHAIATQIGADNTISVAQSHNTNIDTTILQDGTSNRVTVQQAATNAVVHTIEQWGVGNQATVASNGSRDGSFMIEQGGNFNRATVRNAITASTGILQQYGDSNTASSDQQGYQSYYRSEQRGNLNVSDVTQYGADATLVNNLAAVGQVGDRNQARVLQAGTVVMLENVGVVIQFGTRLQGSVTQAGSNNVGLVLQF